MSFNKVIIVGYLGRDPELRHTPQGTAVCKFSVATTEKRKNAAGEPNEITTWFRVSVWGRQGELASEYLSKGRQVYIEGRLRVEEYVDREGATRQSLEVSATDIQFLGQRGDQPVQTHAEEPAPRRAAEPERNAAPERKPAAKTAAPAPARTTQAAPVNRAARNLVSIEEDDIPF